MSYTIGMSGDCDFYSNYTWNLGKMFHAHMEGGIGSLHGLTGTEGYERVMGCLDSIKTEAYKRKNGVPAWKYFSDKYDPDNYWGDCMSACLGLAELAYAFYGDPESIISVT